MSLPASVRHRWGLDEGGEVGYLDIGDAVILIPGGVKRLRRQLLEAVTQDDWDRARSGFGERDLTSE
jgi:bifunctional DNA-binding transcriptional regulator/antitoxin component of YhaV-PrlF toxin-antitoxin module